MTYLALRKISLTLFMLLLTSACIQGKLRNEWKPVDPQSAPVVHQVQWPGETLEFIAKWYTGSTTNLEALADANPNINPGALAIGNKIFIPADLVRKRSAMTKDFLAKSVSANKKTTTKKKEPKPKLKDPDEIEFEVFGPK